MKLDILAFAAHPDDIELSCAGTLLKHIADGKKAGVIDLTRGELGSRGNAETRDAETIAATAILNLSVRENLRLEDGFFRHDKEAMLEIIRMLRKYRPDIVLANPLKDRHPDHGRAGKLVAEACFYSGLVKIGTNDQGISQEAWRPLNVYHYLQDTYVPPDFVIDITPFMERKMESVMAYKTQFYNPGSSEPPTPISSPEFLEFLRARATEMGRNIQVRYAEGFTTVHPPGVRSFFDLQ